MKDDKRKTAVALSYETSENAPKIVASGKGQIAERMIEIAKENQVPVHKDSPLANTLSRLEIGEEIPQELYEVVAEILLFVDDCDKIKKKLGYVKE